VRVIPNARQQNVEIRDGQIRVRVTAPPEKDRANQQVIKAIADFLDIKARQIKLIHGAHSRNKTISVTGDCQLPEGLGR